MKRLLVLVAVLVQGCAVSNVPARPHTQAKSDVMYCETTVSIKDCGYMTKQQERELRRQMEVWSR